MMLLACVLTATYYTSAQVGIGTGIPAADLEVVSKTTLAAGEFNGIIIPKVAALPTSVGPSGLIIYLTAQDGTNAPGLYYSNGTAYINVTDLGAANGVGVFVETTAPTVVATNRSANITRTGRVSIGSTLSSGILNVVENNTATASNQTGIKVENNNAGTANLPTNGVFIENNAANTGDKIGLRSDVSGAGIGTHIGLESNVTDATGNTTNYGIRTRVGATDIVASTAYGVYSEIGSASSQGTNYAVYGFSNHADTTSEPSYSGYFRGDNFAIRSEDDLEGYNLPTTTGTAGQVLTTTAVTAGIASTGWSTVVDDSANNEGILTVAAGGANDSEIVSNTTGSTPVTISGGNGILVSESGSVITITNDRSFTGANGIAVSEIGSAVTITENENFVIRANYSADFGVSNNSPGVNANVIRWFKVNYPNQITTATEFATGTFTASIAGYYNISAHIQSTFGSDINEDFYGLAIYKNGIRIQANQSRNSRFDDFIRRSVSGLHYLDAGDRIEIFLGFPETFGFFNNIESAFSELIIKRLD